MITQIITVDETQYEIKTENPLTNLEIDNIIRDIRQQKHLNYQSLSPLVSNLAISNGIINPQIESSYLIYKEGSTIKAKNGLTGNIDYSGTDAYTVINSAITNGKYIFIKEGIYSINQTFTFDTSWIFKKIQGIKGQTILQPSSSLPNLIYLKNQNLNLNFESLTFDGNNTNCTLVYADDALTVGHRTTYFTDCEFKNSSSNAIFIKGSNVDGVYFNRCYIRDNIGNIRLDRASPHIVFDSCFVINNGPGGYILKSLGSDVRFTNCLFLGMNNATGFIMNDLEGNISWLSQMFIFDSCHIEGPFVGPIFSIGNVSTDYRFERVIIKNSWISNENNPNYLIDIQNMGATIPGTSYISIKDNTFPLPTNPGTAYINLLQTDNVIIEGNVGETSKPITRLSGTPSGKNVRIQQ